MSLVIVCPRRFEDARGWFCETWRADKFAALGLTTDFVQDNQSYSRSKGTLRGLHLQTPPFAQAKLVRCLQGRIFDVVVDARRASPTFGQWWGLELSAENGRQLFVPAGYAHGFVTLEDGCMVAYKVDAPYSATHETGLAWNDPTIGVDWPLDGAPIMSDKDAQLPGLAEFKADLAYDGVPMTAPTEVTP